MNQDLQVETIGKHLDGKTIGLCVTGGIAAIEAPKIARHLRRFGADVHAYVTPSAFEFVGKTALEWGTANPVVDQLSGLAQHINHHDALLVAPATLNTIGKAAHGIADNPVTTLLASALGSQTPIYVASTMHDSLAHNPAYHNNVAFLQEQGVLMMPSRESEGKHKIPPLDDMVRRMVHDMSNDLIKNKRVLITAGATPVLIDDVRRITNRFKGTLGLHLAKELYMKGADVTLLLGNTSISTPSYIDVIRHDTFDEYRNNVFAALDDIGNPYDAALFSAAVADFKPKNVAKGKISSEGELSLEFEHTPKIIEEVRAQYPELFMVTWKYERGISQEKLVHIAKDRITSKGYDVVVANRGEDMDCKRHISYVVQRQCDDMFDVTRAHDRQALSNYLVHLIAER